MNPNQPTGTLVNASLQPVRLMFLALLMITGGCTADPGAAPPTAKKTEQTSSQSASGLAGHYRVTFVAGAPPVINMPAHEPTVTIDDGRIHFQSQCIYADWTYRADRGGLVTSPYLEPGSAMCERALAPGETAIQEALDKVRIARKVRGGLSLEGGGHSLRLERLPGPAGKVSSDVD